MDNENIVRLGQELQRLLPFGIEGITSKKQYVQVIELIDQLTNDRNWELLDILVPAITTYDDAH
ncbi:hypothetical protein [Colwellia hornerae]|uniref:Uncharacterized protein n=1 Tax=Colwellia hornerae TaxID=89402 RepID=A0A5C6QBQ2_9GAMM|nr:hypothetical protein [Colwellia hornerae]TWX53032.1 hypothetical protein ESZ28_10640 [Colwellia hornerae]TWX59295.1 hypothetical protein ESZ26_10020 [Colwellia hornerae]TWX66181.1 hypothetical protein ESZ27_11165 [Colwellia hornerae]